MNTGQLSLGRMGLESWLHRRHGLDSKPGQDHEKYHWAGLNLAKAVLSVSFLHPFSTAWTCLWPLLHYSLFCRMFLLWTWEEKNSEALTSDEGDMFIWFCYTPNLKLASVSFNLYVFPPLSFFLFMFLMLKSPLFQTHSPIFCSAGWCKCVISPSNPSTLSYHHPSLSFSPTICCPWFPCFPSLLLCTAAVSLLLSRRLCLGRVVSSPGWPQVGGSGQLVLEALWEHRVSRQSARVLSQAHGLASFPGIIDIVLFNIYPRRAQTRSSLSQRGSEGEVKLRSIWSWPGEAAAERYDTSSWKQKNCCVRETNHSVLCWAPPGAWWALDSSFWVIFRAFYLFSFLPSAVFFLLFLI